MARIHALILLFPCKTLRLLPCLMSVQAAFTCKIP